MPDPIFGREQELLELRGRLGKRKPLLIHGPEGVGKTLLVKALLPGIPDYIYCAESATIQTVFRTVMEVLWERRNDRVRQSCGRAGLQAVRAKSATNVKGVVMDALHDGHYCLILDHVKRPAYAFASGVREVLHWGGTPVIALARSSHMEDVGFLQGIYSDKADRYEIRNFDREIAMQFALDLSDQLNIKAENFTDLLDKVLEYSHGNPGAIVSMLKMATYPKYRMNDHIKIAPLYIDFRMSWQPAKVHRGTAD
jgi:DNA polymerase III delta prime subunit